MKESKRFVRLDAFAFDLIRFVGHANSDWLCVRTRMTSYFVRMYDVFKCRCATFLRAHLHQASALRQLCDEACDSVLIENNGVTPEWVCNLFSSDSTDFNENRVASVIAELSQR